VRYIWQLISRHANSINPYSKDITLPKWKIRDAIVKATIHRTDAVTIIIACSSVPFTLDYDGILRLSNCLSIVEERIQGYVDQCLGILNQSDSYILVPSHMSWTVLMWHFGADALTEYSGKTFCLTWKLAQDILVRAYTKKTNRKKLRIRLENQECPRKSLAEAIQDKLIYNYPKNFGMK
jgi:hypothetical protein